MLKGSYFLKADLLSSRAIFHFAVENVEIEYTSRFIPYYIYLILTVSWQLF